MGNLRDFVGWFSGVTCVALVLLAACGHEGPNEMSWARAALERNKALEVVAADQQSRTFTVRLRESGELRTVRADAVIASLASAPPAAVAAAARQNQQAGAAAEPAVAQTDTASGGETAAPAPAAVTRPDPVLTSETSTDLAKVAPGRVLESGPGYSIAAAQAATPGAARMRESASSAPLERRHEPIVCQGARMLRIDNRNLVFDGDAVSAMEGCEIYITNSHISASGVGVAARAASVHIDNSQIEGEQASIDLSQGAQVYAASSRFKGLSRRLDTATVHDLGGNIWN